MKRYITDLEGNLLEVTDLKAAISQVAMYISFLYNNMGKEQQEFAQKRQKYWKNVFSKLNHLKAGIEEEKLL